MEMHIQLSNEFDSQHTIDLHTTYFSRTEELSTHSIFMAATQALGRLLPEAAARVVTQRRHGADGAQPRWTLLLYA